ncbi:MAG: hypothetical protein M1352_02685 [Patescibacteria group bacterium]|nr:hypothetical protein [Patescibacteria group bacterium]
METKDYQELHNLIKISVEPNFVIRLVGPNPSIKSFWVMLKSKTSVVEGKLFLQNSRTKLVIFEPGFPGGGSTQFEKLWLRKTLEKGYSVFLARHGGTIINGKFSSRYLNCPERQELEIANRVNGLSVLGNKKEYNIADWLIEPLTAMKILVPHFSDVVLCGHSFGPLALIYSLIRFVEEEPRLSRKIYRVVSLSGSIGKIRSYDNSILKVWQDHLNTEWARERVQVGDHKRNTDIFEEAHKAVNDNVSIIPKDVTLIAVVPYGDTENSIDEIVNPMESIDFINSLGRGYFIVDKTEWGDKKTGRMTHDMEALTSDTLVKLLSKDWIPESRITTIE